MGNIPLYTVVTPINVKSLPFVELDSLIILIYLDLKKYVVVYNLEKPTFLDFLKNIFQVIFRHFFFLCIFLIVLVLFSVKSSIRCTTFSNPEGILKCNSTD